MAMAADGGWSGVTWAWLILLGVAWIGYLAARWSPRCRGNWPWQRSVLWSLGLAVAGAATIGPIAERGRDDFRLHMVGHLAIGMLAPLCLAQAAPITLILRTLPTIQARRFVRLLERRGPRLLTHPVTAALLDVGGLWLLFTTRLFPLAHRHAWLDAAVDLHMVLAGYLFAAAFVGIDPVRRRPSWAARTAVLIPALAAHAILAKWLFAHPPAGVDPFEARAAAELMYYGGDLIEAALLVLFCRRWMQSTRPRGEGAGSVVPVSARCRVHYG